MTRSRTSVADPAIAAHGLVKRFGTVLALDGVDLAVEAGTVLGLLGPNGAGKTTAVRILATILQPDAGHASVLGLDVARRAEQVRAVIGLAGQYAAVDENLTGRENLRLIGQLTHQPRPAVAARADGLLARFGLEAAAGRPVRTYSGGMRRRLDLAAALGGLEPEGKTVLFTGPSRGMGRCAAIELARQGAEILVVGTIRVPACSRQCCYDPPQRCPGVAAEPLFQQQRRPGAVAGTAT